jgi:ribosomal protein S18
MIKKYLEFIAENKRPGKDIGGSQKIDITGEELDLFSTEPQLQKLIRDEKVSVLSGEVWYKEGDHKTKEVLDQYLEINNNKMNESVEDDFETNSINLKKSLKKLIERLAVHESSLRSVNDIEGITEVVNMLLELIKNIFRHAMMKNPNYELGEKETLIKKFIESVEESKKVFINKGFYQGIDFLVDNYTPKLIKFIEGEEVEEEEDLSKLGNRQLNSLIDDALDRKDFKRVEILSRYLKESTEIIKELVEEVANDICRAFIDYIDGFLEIR